MKIISGIRAKQIDQFTMEHEPIASIDLMERAGLHLAEKINHIFTAPHAYTIFAGPGNNGGDGLVMARLLHEQKNSVQVFVLGGKEYSAELTENISRAKGIPIHTIQSESDISSIHIPGDHIIIDALYGSGLNRPLEGMAATLVEKINSTLNFKISVDVPSGLYADNLEVKPWSNEKNTIKANLTLSIQFPKLGFMFAENESFTGDWELVDIGLMDPGGNDEVFYLDPVMVKDMIRTRPSFGHKGSFGHVLICAGSKGKIGAAILSAKAAARTGCGLLTVHVPSSAAIEVHSKFPEAMVVSDENENILSTPVKNITNYSAVGFGPGVDKDPATANVLKQLIQNASQPLVIDADGLNILSENKTWLSFVNGKTILTPHPGEFDRLTKKHLTGFERYQSQLEFSKKYGVYLVLKGHHTCVTTPSGMSFFNSTGNSGMATGGSGDVLTGIITSLCAQGYSPLHASLIGVYLHGYAGDRAAEEISKTSLIASDIIDHIPDFFLNFEK
jgi:ADP-dependent NAD(P)H-hydrate dehydratase / NAD(P)H-hydrate epimerase